jgi:phosphate transport system substrate-binding protein
MLHLSTERRSGRIIRSARSVLLAFVIVSGQTWAGPTGHILIAGYGPELPVMQDLAQAFEKANPGTAIDFEWEKNVKAVERLRNGDAQIAVADQEVPGLKATPIAWDGIAVIVNFTNPVKEVTSEQVRGLFTGKVRRWSDLDGADSKVVVIDRTVYDNVKVGFEESLGIVGQVIGEGRPVRTDQRALSVVSGKDSAVSYISLASALKAAEYGIPIRVLTIDRVEPAEPTIANGQYKLRRPVLLLSNPSPDPVTQAFLAFAVSPEGQKIVKSMFVPYQVSPAAPKQVRSSPEGSGS